MSLSWQLTGAEHGGGIPHGRIVSCSGYIENGLGVDFMFLPRISRVFRPEWQNRAIEFANDLKLCKHSPDSHDSEALSGQWRPPACRTWDPRFRPLSPCVCTAHRLGIPRPAASGDPRPACVIASSPTRA